MKKIAILGIALITLLTLSANAQKFGKTPEDSLKCIENVSLYTEFYKQNNFDDAYTPWKEAVTYCPAYSKNLYIHGAKILQSLITKKGIDPVRRDTLMEELFRMFDTRARYFGEPALNKARKAYYMASYKGKNAVERYYPIFAEAMAENPAEVDPAYIDKYFEATIDYVTVAKKADVDLIIDNYNTASTALETSLANTAPEDKSYDKIRQALATVEQRFSPFASCDKLEEIFAKKFEATPDDTNLLRKICSLLDSKKCIDSKLYFNATERLHSMVPSAETAYLMGNLCLNNKQYSKAADYFQEAANGLEKDEDKFKAYLRLANAYAGAHSYSAARSAAYKAAGLNPNSGEPYLIIASLYASSSSSCGDTPAMKRAGYWAAVDKAVKARNIDPSPDVQARANKLIGQYSSRFPSKEDAFMENLIDGHSVTVGGWIGETTTVRTR